MTEEISMMTNSLFEAGTAANRIAVLNLKGRQRYSKETSQCHRRSLRRVAPTLPSSEVGILITMSQLLTFILPYKLQSPFSPDRATKTENQTIKYRKLICFSHAPSHVGAIHHIP